MSLIARPHTSPASQVRHVATHLHGHRTDRLPLIVHPDHSPHPCHSLTRDKNPNRNARARISSNPGFVSRLRATRILFSLCLGAGRGQPEPQTHGSFNGRQLGPVEFSQ